MAALYVISEVQNTLHELPQFPFLLQEYVLYTHLSEVITAANFQI
jgi:hypothetical protein